MDSYTALLFEGGGMKGMCFVGALLELTKERDGGGGGGATRVSSSKNTPFKSTST